MAARVVHIDLAQPLPPTLGAGKRCDALWVLVKFGMQPLGWFRCAARRCGGTISHEALAQLIADHLSLQALDAARSRTFAQVGLKSHPSFSVAVCARDARQVERTLESLAKLDYAAAFEVIVVDHALKSGAVRNACGRFAFARHVVEPRPGAGYARNTAWQVARHEVVAFVDEGDVVDPHWLTALAENFAEPRVQCVLGMTLPRELDTAAQEFWERQAGSRRELKRRVLAPGGSNVMRALERFEGDVTLAVRRATIESMGGFDVALGAGDAAVADVVTRVLRDGGSAVYEPRAITFRAAPRTMRQLRAKTFRRGFGFAAYCAKFVNDLELANDSAALLVGTWKRRGIARLRECLWAALRLRPHEPLGLVVPEIMGMLLGLPAYRRAVRRLRNDGLRFTQKGIVKPLKAAA